MNCVVRSPSAPVVLETGGHLLWGILGCLLTFSSIDAASRNPPNLRYSFFFNTTGSNHFHLISLPHEESHHSFYLGFMESTKLDTSVHIITCLGIIHSPLFSNSQKLFTGIIVSCSSSCSSIHCRIAISRSFFRPLLHMLGQGWFSSYPNFYVTSQCLLGSSGVI